MTTREHTTLTSDSASHEPLVASQPLPSNEAVTSNEPRTMDGDNLEARWKGVVMNELLATDQTTDDPVVANESATATMVLMAPEATISEGVRGSQEKPIDLTEGYKTPDDQTNLTTHDDIQVVDLRTYDKVPDSLASEVTSVYHRPLKLWPLKVLFGDSVCLYDSKKERWVSVNKNSPISPKLDSKPCFEAEVKIQHSGAPFRINYKKGYWEGKASDGTLLRVLDWKIRLMLRENRPISMKVTRY